MNDKHTNELKTLLKLCHVEGEQENSIVNLVETIVWEERQELIDNKDHGS